LSIYFSPTSELTISSSQINIIEFLKIRKKYSDNCNVLTNSVKFLFDDTYEVPYLDENTKHLSFLKASKTLNLFWKNERGNHFYWNLFIKKKGSNIILYSCRKKEIKTLLLRLNVRLQMNFNIMQPPSEINSLSSEILIRSNTICCWLVLIFILYLFFFNIIKIQFGHMSPI
jgi:hypothetical protein